MCACTDHREQNARPAPLPTHTMPIHFRSPITRLFVHFACPQILKVDDHVRFGSTTYQCLLPHAESEVFVSPSSSVMGGSSLYGIVGREASAGSKVPVVEAVEEVFSNEDLFESISSRLGAWGYLDLGCVCKAFSQNSWDHMLRLLRRTQVLPEEILRRRDETFGSALQLKFAGMPEKLLLLRKTAFALGLNANGTGGLAGVLSLLSNAYPELRGLSKAPSIKTFTASAGSN